MTGIELNDLPKQFQWNSLSSERFINVSSSKDIKEIIQDKEHFISYDKKVVHNVVSRFNDINETVAKHSLHIGVKTLGKHLEEITPGLIKNAKMFQKHVKRMSNLKRRNPHKLYLEQNDNVISKII